MAAAELTTSAPRAARLWLPADLGVAWLYAYVAIWIAMLASAALVALAGRAVALPVRHLLGLTLTAHHNPSPSLGHVLVLAAHNIPIAAWPLLLGIAGAHRHRLATRVADTVLLACIMVNALPVGAALGAYGAPVLAYLPQLPFESAGIALGVSAWLVQRRDSLTLLQGLTVFVLIVGVLSCAATIETFGVPHR
jgi:hypothetical protein